MPAAVLPPLSVALPDPAATRNLARRLAALARPGDLLALHGDLGAGKTEFARAFIQERGTADEVPSPTFTLVQTYDPPGGTIWHFDLYRLSGPDEVEELGWEEARADGIVLVEWPDRLGHRLPADRLDIELRQEGETGRRAVLTGHGSWPSRLAQLGVAGPGLAA
jgi:tRNA threonylcarbamoyladenosine biosynthesis protein TsaE